MNKHTASVMVSVIIVNWNAREFLLSCLASLYAGACCHSMEIVVVDNASTDGSVAAVNKKFPQVRLIQNSANLGFARANNLGTAASTGRYLCYVNSDVKVLTDCISRLVDYGEQAPRVGMAGPRIVGGDGRLQRSCRGFPSLWNMLCRALALDTLFSGSRLFTGYSLVHWSQEELRAVDILSGCFWLVRRDALNQVGPLDEAFFMYGEDLDWCKRFWNRGWKVVYVPTAEAIHYGGASSANAPLRFFIERQRADLQYWRKHHARPAVAAFFLISLLHLALRALGYTLALGLNRHERPTYRQKVARSVACLKWMFTGREPVAHIS